MSIQGKLKSGFLLVIVFLLLQTLITFFYVSNSGQLVSQAVTQNFRNSQFISQLSVDGHKLRRYEKEYFIYVHDDQKRDKYYEQWRDAKDSIARRLKNAITSRESWTGYDNTEFREWAKSLDAYASGFETVNRMVLSGTIVDTVTANTRIQPSKNEFGIFLHGTDKLGKEKLVESEKLAEQIENNFKMLYLVIFAISAAGIVFLVILLKVIPRSIAQPVKELTHAARVMSKGDLNNEIKTSEIEEFRSLSETLERMRVSQRALIDRILGTAQ